MTYMRLIITSMILILSISVSANSDKDFTVVGESEYTSSFTHSPTVDFFHNTEERLKAELIAFQKASDKVFEKCAWPIQPQLEVKFKTNPLDPFKRSIKSKINFDCITVD